MLLCDVWVCFDVLCCTASILHLVAIALDRYWAVTNVDYIRRRTAGRIGGMIAGVWIASALISIPARFNQGREKNEWRRVLVEGECKIFTGPIYTIFSTVGAFYLPMFFILGIYVRIYRTARRRIRRKAFRRSQSSLRTAEDTPDLNLAPPPPPRRPRAEETPPCLPPIGEHSAPPPGPPPLSPGPPPLSPGSESSTTSASKRSFRDFANGSLILFRSKSSTSSMKERLEQKRERKAARTLSIITGCFLLCWLPFFINALVSPFLNRSMFDVSPILGSVCLWLGYFNSLLNPLLYTIFAPEFRNAFRKILFGRYRRRKLRRRV